MTSSSVTHAGSQPATVLGAAGLTTDVLTAGVDRPDGLTVRTPIDGSVLATLATHSADGADAMIAAASEAFAAWRAVPAPRRGELVRLIGDELRSAKRDLGRLVSLECGKIFQEGLGEVQEMIDICDFAVGLSRQLYGLTIASERPGHHMRETWHPMGVCGIITAFNFPVAPWCWNAALALVCGDPVLWKPSEKTPLTALATQAIVDRAISRFDADGGEAPAALSQVLIGGPELGRALTASSDVAIVSATGSSAMGRKVSVAVAERFGRAILELGGNNAMIVSPSADLDMALRAIVFSAVGTAGQRCTTLRRLIVHEDVRADLVERLQQVYANLPIGDPLDDTTLVGPLIDEAAHTAMSDALDRARADGASVFGGERVRAEVHPDAFYVNPAIVELEAPTDLTREETFAPILYVMPYRTLDEAIDITNDVPQGLSSCIFSTDVRETELFLSAIGSDCGIANVNIGPSGAEIGGAFGGEKETGGGRESGSDAWKGYMRRQTQTINFSRELPLAQGIRFEV
ncbi:MAG: aldehyde dehydrogenase family protein [Ilumatobacter sp.]|jgi:aldehyde dehydrogenase (NAD+)|uniref:L-piperidine-6-carboxylate dehydrogenase n=1 Tax=Ilumatobacter sp. TaxID=1967498 RepID=UPI00391AA01D